MKNHLASTRIAAAICVAILLAACSLVSSPTETSTTETTVADTTTSTPATAPSTTATTTPATTTPEATGFETIACGEASGEIFCETYELIQRHYVDPVANADLVDGALTALAESEVPVGDGMETCFLPSDEFVEVCQAIEDGGFDDEAAEQTAIAGMIFYALDPNSSYFDADALALIEEEQSGQIEGIGALVATEEEGSDVPNSCAVIGPDCRLRIVSTIEGGPARAADLQADDEFVAVNGESIEGLSIDQITSQVRGPAGTDVDLTFLRNGEEFDITIIRAAIQVPVAEAEMVGDIAYLRLNVFTDNADEQVHQMLEELLANNPSQIVLDLRNNPGGLLDTAVNITSEFISSGVVVSTESPESTTPYNVEPGGIATDPSLPMYVVVNQGSASASEVLAGALDDMDRALIVGENTFGKNTVQQRFPLSNGGAVKLTIARWLTPEGRDFGGSGITPDVVADLPETLTVEELVEAVTTTGTSASS
ncbi:hypothetical protein BH23ACT4_BH23ACT4_16940 [soil metagenome]